MAAPPIHLSRTVRRDLGVTAAALTVLLFVTTFVPQTRLEIDSLSVRAAVETLRLCVVGFAALVLALPHEQHDSVVRNALVAALVVIAAAAALLGIVPAITTELTGTAPPDRFYPWLASRYVAGLLFVSAAAQWPRVGMRWYVIGALAVFVVVAGLLTAAVPLRAVPPGDGGLAWLISLELPALLLFAFGVVLAARLAVMSGAPLERWLALALLVGVFTQLQAIRQPDVLGPVVTTTDALRVLATLLLLTGAAAQVRQMSRDRATVVRLQREDLEQRDAMMDALARYVDREETFRAVVHHELATPIATIRAFAHVLTQVDAEDERWRGALDGILAEAEQLNALIGRVDELKSLEAASFVCRLRPVRVAPLLHDIARFARALPGRHVVDVHADDGRIMADPVRLGQALRNLVTNAVRYSPDGGRIGLIGDVAQPGRYRVTVVDQGIGIDADNAGALLAYAGRGRNTEGREGTGIGLYVARRIVEAHDGQLVIVPNVPTGTRVTIEVGCA